MSKKLLAACLVIAAFAVVPSLASAKPVLTHPTGTILPAGTKLLATNIGETTMTLPGGGAIHCTTASLTGTLKSNSTAGGFQGEIETAKFSGTGSAPAGDEKECTGTFNSAVTPLSLPWCLEGTEANDTFKLKGGKCGAQTALTFRLISTILGFPVTCNYERTTLTGPVTGTFTTHSSGDLIGTISEQAFKREATSPESCPSEGKLDMSFTIETDTTASADPVYASE